MSRSHQCIRDYSRENVSPLQWREFFRAQKDTPFVFMLKDTLEETFTMDNIVGYVSGVEHNDDGFSYILHHITEEIGEDEFLHEYTIEPVVSYIRCGRSSITSRIEGLALVKQHD